ncbi:LTA synthase family protein [Cohnella yongneupensis]|uniref:LTA synthase family protein n=1 Tax=Cohnella yongneupensis TaxID=425006 RepID=A0ABW0QZP0_9BACL
MGERLKATAKKVWPLLLNGLTSWPYWGFMLFVLSIVYKLEWLDHQFNVGAMNDWKWKVNYGAAILAAFWTLLLGRRARWITLVVLDLVLSALLFSDLIYFRYFKDFISIPVLFQAGQVGELTDSIWGAITLKDFILFADLPIGLAGIGWIVWRRSRDKKQRAKAYVPSIKRRLLLRLIPGTIAFTLGWSLIYYPVETQKDGWARGLFAGAWWNVPIYNVTGLLGFHGYDVYRYAKENWFSDKLSKQEEQQASEWFDARRKLQQQMESELMFGEYKGKNVLVVQMEAFQQFVIGQSIGGEEITPNLNKLIGQSLYFPNFYHQTGQGHTSDADFSTSCSMHPLPTGSVFIRFSNNEFDCAPSILKTQGYDTTVHHAYDGSFWNRNNMYNDMEYDQFYNLKNYKFDDPLGWSISDKSFFRQTVDQLKTRDSSPFYAMAITLSSHHPFDLPLSTQELNVAPFTGTIFGDYIQATHYVDSAVGDLIEDLKAAGLYDNTILVFYGDHDNYIYDTSVYDKFYGRPLTEMEKDAILRKVPYIIHLPNDEHAGVIDKAVGQIDTLPTIMHLLGIPATDNDYLMGISALSEAPKSVVFRNGGFTDGMHYFVPSSDGVAEHGACYSLPSGEAEPDVAACKMGADAAKNDLLVSDRVVEHDLIAKFRKAKE